MGNPPPSQTNDKLLASPNMIVIHAIDEIVVNQRNIQENSSSQEEELVLQPLLQVTENLDEHAINNPASMTIGKPHTSHDVNNMLVDNNISLDSSELLIVNEISSESSEKRKSVKKRKSVGKPSNNIIKKKLKISQPRDEVAIPTTSTPSVPTITRKTKNKKIAKDPHDMPVKKKKKKKKKNPPQETPGKKKKKKKK